MKALSHGAVIAAIVIGGLLLGSLAVDTVTHATPAGPAARAVGDNHSFASALHVSASARSVPLSIDAHRATSTIANPAVCRQGMNTIDLDPLGVNHNMTAAFLTDLSTLAGEGGGTLQLGAGYYQFNETITITRGSNVSIQGVGMGKTILTLPPSPIGKFTNDAGVDVSLFNETNQSADSVTANFIQVNSYLYNFEMCNLTVDAQANNASEDWLGSVIFDSWGGVHHVYSDIALTGLYGPAGTPNGLHIDEEGGRAAVGYVIDGLSATNDSWPSTPHAVLHNGPNFLNTGGVTNCTEENITGIGNLEYEVAPSVGCLIENVNTTDMLIDPGNDTPATGGWVLPAGSWGGTLFQNLTSNADIVGGPNALQISLANGSSHGRSTFSDLFWNDDHFVGAVSDAVNMVNVQNSTFDDGLNATPSIFEGNSVTWNPALSPERLSLPIRVDGAPMGGCSAILSDNLFVFPNGTGKYDPFLLTVPDSTWSNETIEISGTTNGYVLSAPKVTISQSSSFSNITYDSLGNGSPPELILFDIVGSPGFEDVGASIGPLVRIYNDLPLFVPSTPKGLTGTAKGLSEVGLAWNASSGPLTNYTVLVGDNPSSWGLNYSVGLQTQFVVDGLPPGTALFFAVEAWNFSFHSGISTPVEATTPPLSAYEPGVPTGLVVASLGISDVGIRWNPSTGNVTNYTVYTGTNASTLTPSFSVGEATNFTIVGLEPDTTYYFAVMAWNGSWTSGLSSSVNATTRHQVLVPTGPAGSAGPSSMSAQDWIVVFGTMAGIFAVIVGALALAGRIRTTARTRLSSRATTKGARPGRRPNSDQRGSLR